MFLSSVLSGVRQPSLSATPSVTLLHVITHFIFALHQLWLVCSYISRAISSSWININHRCHVTYFRLASHLSRGLGSWVMVIAIHPRDSRHCSSHYQLNTWPCFCFRGNHFSSALVMGLHHRVATRLQPQHSNNRPSVYVSSSPL